MTITPTSAGAELDAHAPGAIDKYTTAELDQISAVRRRDLSLKQAEREWRFEVVRLKLMLDQQDAAEGLVQAGQVGRPPSRFWDGAEAGDFGSRLQGMADNGNRKTVSRWLEANDAAAKLLGNNVTAVTKHLPLQLAAERGIGPSTLEIYGSLDDEAREVADYYYEQRQELKADMLKEFRQVCTGFPERKNELLQGLSDESLRYPSDIQELMVEWDAQRREQIALEKGREEALALLVAEENEAAAASYRSAVEPEEHVGDQLEPEDIAARRSPSRQWYQSKSGKLKVDEVVGDLAQPLAGLVDSLAELSKRLDDQFSHASVMHNYAEFWAGYDKFFYTESTARGKWGRGGRLERMRRLRSQMKEIAGKLDVYISASAPPEGIEYPED